MDSRYEFLNGVQEMGNPKMVASDENIDVDCTQSFVVDLESVSRGVDNDLTNFYYATTSNSRIIRSLSKKEPQRGIEKKFTDTDTLVLSSSPRDGEAIAITQHQITIKTGGSANNVHEGRSLGRRSSFKRTSSSWYNNPKRILFFFATLSSMGTMLLILLTLVICKRNEKGGVLDWQ